MILLTVLFILLELSFWPGYLVHDYFYSKSRGYGVYCKIGDEGTNFTQYFIPQMRRLASIDIAASFPENEVGDEKIKFTLYDETGKEVLCRWIPISQMEDGRYYTIPIRKKLKADAQYHWTVEVTESLPYDWSLMLSEDKTGIAPENTFLEMNGIPGIGDEAQTVSQYAYYIHKDKVIILATCWCGTFLVYLTGMEIIQKIFNRKK